MGNGGATGNGGDLEFEDFVFEFEDDSLGESGSDSGGGGEGFGVLGEDGFDGTSFGEGADEGKRDFCATAFDFAEHFEKSALAWVAESVEGVIGFADDKAGVEVDGCTDDAVFDEDGVRNMDFVAYAVTINDNGG